MIGTAAGRWESILRKLGYRNVLCIADNRSCMDLWRYKSLCEGLGVQADFLQVPMRKRERDSFYQQDLARLHRYSVIFAVSDYYAADLMRFLQKSGMRVPEDISIAGFDDSAICEQVSPALTSVRQDGAYRARTTLQLLKQMRQQPDFSGDFLASVQLIPRDSTSRSNY